MAKVVGARLFRKDRPAALKYTRAKASDDVSKDAEALKEVERGSYT